MFRKPGIWIGVLLILLAVGLFFVFQPTAAPTPTPTPTPLATPSPTLAPLSPPVTVDLTGKISDTGILLEDVVIASSDGRAKLTLPKGALVMDDNRQPAKSVTCTPFQPPESKEGLVVGLGYEWAVGESAGELGHHGTIMPVATVSITYDSPPANPRIDLSKPDIAVWSAEKQLWVKCPSPVTAELATRTLTGSLANFGSAVVIYWYTDVST